MRNENFSNGQVILRHIRDDFLWAITQFCRHSLRQQKTNWFLLQTVLKKQCSFGLMKPLVASFLKSFRIILLFLANCWSHFLKKPDMRNREKKRIIHLSYYYVPLSMIRYDNYLEIASLNSLFRKIFSNSGHLRRYWWILFLLNFYCTFLVTSPSFVAVTKSNNYNLRHHEWRCKYQGLTRSDENLKLKDTQKTFFSRKSVLFFFPLHRLMIPKINRFP